MFKHLLLSAAVATIAMSASAETKVLWATDVPEGFKMEWGNPALSLDAEQAATINAGDILTMTVVGVDTECVYPQVALFDGDTPWPPITNVGVGGKTYPYVASFPVTNDMADTFHAKGVVFKGDGAYVSEISQIEGSGYLDPNTVWFGHEQLAWGTAITIPNTVFADVKPGDKIQVNYDTEAKEHTLQIILGGWGGLNLATYEAGAHDFMTIDEESGVITIELTDALNDYTWGDKTYDVYTILKESGLVMQGPCIVDAVLFIPYTEETVNYYAVGSFQGWNVEEPAVFTFADGVYTLVAENASTMKISTLAGDWESFNSATIAPSNTEEIFDDGSVPFVVVPDYEFILDYQATWKVTIDPAKRSILFTTDDPKPQVYDIYLRGSMNNWEADDAWKFTTTDGDLFVLENVTIEAGTQFKVADATWGTVNYGTSAAIVLEEPVVLVYSGPNCTVSETLEDISVKFNLTTKTLTLTKTTGIDSIANESAEAIYYNVQGIRVTNPVEGNLYIVKKGSKVSKVAF